MKLNVRDSPVLVCILSMLLVCLTYLVYIHRQYFEGFFHFIIMCAFIVLGVLLIAAYNPFMRYYAEHINAYCKQSSFKPHMDFHEQFKPHTVIEVNKLIKSQKYQEFEAKKKQNPEQPVVLCPAKPFEQIQDEAKELEEFQTQIFQEPLDLSDKKAA